MVSDRTVDRIERLLIRMIELDGLELRRQREETKRLRALFKQREEERARRLEEMRAQRPRSQAQPPDWPDSDPS
jgi:predicted neuraminidase